MFLRGFRQGPFEAQTSSSEEMARVLQRTGRCVSTEVRIRIVSELCITPAMPAARGSPLERTVSRTGGPASHAQGTLVTSLFDTGVLIDYLTGRPEAVEVFAAQTFGAISVVSWVELMSVAPPRRRGSDAHVSPAVRAQRGDRRSRRGPVSPPSGADAASRLIYATALINSLTFVMAYGPMALEREVNVRVRISARCQRADPGETRPNRRPHFFPNSSS
jgi:hypothetical protein